MSPAFPCDFIHTAVCIEFIKVLKRINNCELINAAKVIPQHRASIQKILRNYTVADQYKTNFLQHV